MGRTVNAWARAFLAGFLLWLVLAITGALAQDPEISRPVDASNRVKVFIALFVADVDSVDTANQSFEAKVYVIYTWQDPRLVHNGPGAITKPLSQIWNPRLQIVNQQRIWSTLPEVASITPEGHVVYRQGFWGSFSQPLRLRDFPFDSQTFTFQVVAAGYTPEEVELKPHETLSSGIADSLSVADWKVINWKTKSAPYQPVPGARSNAAYSFSFEVKRLTGYFVVKVILPLILIVAMSWVVFWIDPSQAGSNIGVSVTSMLTLIAYRFAVDASLPKLPYLTCLDYFILASTFLVFFSLIEVMLASGLARRGKLEKAHLMDRLCRMIFPCIFVMIGLETLVFRIFL